MNILYKYCDSEGAKKILETLTLKLPYATDVNDPLECLPIFDCPSDVPSIERALSKLKKVGKVPPSGYTDAPLIAWIKDAHMGLQKEWNKKACLLCVSQAKDNSLMWAHYSEKHKGAVLGIDFDDAMEWSAGLDKVSYELNRIKIDVSHDSSTLDEFLKSITTKSKDWEYEHEYRIVFTKGTLETLNEATKQDFRGVPTWFLRLKPQSIKEVIFGLNAEEKFKSSVQMLTTKNELQHVRFSQTAITETYSFEIVPL